MMNLGSIVTINQILDQDTAILVVEVGINLGNKDTRSMNPLKLKMIIRTRLEQERQ